MDRLVAMAKEHGAQQGEELDDEDAALMIEGWRQWGIVRNLSLGEYLDMAFEGDDEDATSEGT